MLGLAFVLAIWDSFTFLEFFTFSFITIPFFYILKHTMYLHQWMRHLGHVSRLSLLQIHSHLYTFFSPILLTWVIFFFMLLCLWFHFLFKQLLFIFKSLSLIKLSEIPLRCGPDLPQILHLDFVIDIEWGFKSIQVTKKVIE